MTSKERVLGAINRKKIDRVPMWECFWGTTATNWHGQGLPSDVTDLEEYFNLDVKSLRTYVDWSFQFPSEVIEDNDEYKIYVSSENVKTKVMKIMVDNGCPYVMRCSEYFHCNNECESNKKQECESWRVYSVISGTVANAENAEKPVTNSIIGGIANAIFAEKGVTKIINGKTANVQYAGKFVTKSMNGTVYMVIAGFVVKSVRIIGRDVNVQYVEQLKGKA